MKPAYRNSTRRTRQMNKTLYLKPEDAAVWERAAKLLPFHRGQSVSQFCTEKIKEIVKELEAIA